MTPSPRFVRSASLLRVVGSGGDNAVDRDGEDLEDEETSPTRTIAISFRTLVPTAR